MEPLPGDDAVSLPVRLYAGRALGMATGLDLAGWILQKIITFRYMSFLLSVIRTELGVEINCTCHRSALKSNNAFCIEIE